MESTKTELLGSLIYSMPTNTPIYLGETERELAAVKVTCDDNGNAIRLYFKFAGETEGE